MFSIARNDVDGAVRVIRERRAAGVLRDEDYEIAYQLQDDPAALERALARK
jgi:uncharacterized membrane protein